MSDERQRPLPLGSPPARRKARGLGLLEVAELARDSRGAIKRRIARSRWPKIETERKR